mgnify:CR=1 FL=1
MKLEVGKIYLDTYGNPIYIYGMKGDRFLALDVKYNKVYFYNKDGKDIYRDESLNLVSEYCDVDVDFAIDKGIVLKDSNGERIWLKANIQSLPYPLIGMYVDRINEQAIYKETEKFTIAKDDEIDDLNLDDVLMVKFKRYWVEL